MLSFNLIKFTNTGMKGLKESNILKDMWLYISISLFLHFITALLFLKVPLKHETPVSLNGDTVFVDMLDDIPVEKETRLPTLKEEPVGSISKKTLPPVSKPASKTSPLKKSAPLSSPPSGGNIPDTEINNNIHGKLPGDTHQNNVSGGIPPLSSRNGTLQENSSPSAGGKSGKKRNSFDIINNDTHYNSNAGAENNKAYNDLPFLGKSEKEVLSKAFRLAEQESTPDHISINTNDLRYLSYMTKLKEKIELVWNYPVSAQMQGLSGSVIVRFKINKNGNLNEVELLASSGYKILDDNVIFAIESATPYDLFPAYWKEEELVVVGNFIYKNNRILIN